MSESARNVIVVPVSVVGSPRARSPCGFPRSYDWVQSIAVAANFDVELLGQRVDDRHADPVQSAGDLVAAAVAELAAGVQDGEHDLDRGALLLLHERDRDATAVVDDGDGVVRMDRDRDVVAVAGERLVNRVINNLVDEMVQTSHARSSRCTCPAAGGPPRDPRGR